MTQLLDKTIAEITKLPPEKQEAFLRWILEELEDQQWQQSFDQSADLLEQMADEALADFHAGRTEELDPDKL